MWKKTKPSDNKDSIFDNALKETDERPRNGFNHLKKHLQKDAALPLRSKNATEAITRKLLKDVHYCVVYHETVFRGNQSTLKKHVKTNPRIIDH